MSSKRSNYIVLSLIVLGTIQEAYHIFRKVRIKEHIESLSGKLLTKMSSYDFETSGMGQEFKVTQSNCSKIVNNHTEEIQSAKKVMLDMLPEPDLDLSFYMELRHDCSKFKQRRGYILHKLTEEEEQFPIAFSVLFYKDFHQVEKLLRAIYRRHNYYCLVVDSTANPLIQAVVRVYAECFDNVIWLNKIDIVWGTLSLGEGEFVCMYELQKFKKWKYFINLTGQEYPLKTNLQIVKILKSLNGSNDVYTASPVDQTSGTINTWKNIGPVPHGIKLVKGSAHVIFSRPFVSFLTMDKRVMDFVTFLDPAITPQEALWSSINNDPTLHAPGGFNGTPLEGFKKPSFRREKWWVSMKRTCRGHYVRDICIFGVADIPTLSRSLGMFGNKFFLDSEPMALRCLQEWLYNRTRDEYLRKYTFDVSPYTELLAHSRRH